MTEPRDESPVSMNRAFHETGASVNQIPLTQFARSYWRRERSERHSRRVIRHSACARACDYDPGWVTYGASWSKHEKLPLL
jgi:hypothetical protein